MADQARRDDREHPDDSFLSRWSRRKVALRRGEAIGERAAVAVPAPDAQTAGPEPTQASPRPTTSTAASTAAAAPGGPIVEPVRDGTAAPLAAGAPRHAAEPGPPEAQQPPAPTMDDVAQLTRQSDFSRFVAGDVDRGVQQAALKKLFSDPHFNVMDGLDVYIDDYSRPDPLPAGMLRKMAQAQLLGLFSAEPRAGPDPAVAGSAVSPAASTTPPSEVSTTAMAPRPHPPALTTDAPDAAATDPEPSAPDEDPDLRLQPDDAAGRQGVAASPGEDTGHRG